MKCENHCLSHKHLLISFACLILRSLASLCTFALVMLYSYTVIMIIRHIKQSAQYIHACDRCVPDISFVVLSYVKNIYTKMTYVYTNAQCLCRISCVCFCVFFLSLVAVHSYVPIHQQPLISYRISFCPKVCKCGQIVDKFPVDLFCLVFFVFFISPGFFILIFLIVIIIFKF